ncbi:MAG: serine/threonine protein kinase, partial [Myxococcales bacterium]|nr:serine/threonine protein kinase [Myxococcales bacterium]
MRDPLGLCGVVLEGRYRVDEVVGEGGFGVVYRGVHLGLGGAVAIKALKLDPQAPAAERERVLEAFDAEGKLLFSLAQRHPAFARVLDRGLVTRRAVAAGTLPTGDYMAALSSGREEPLFPYLVLEWLEGETLAEEQTRRREAGAPARSLAEVVELLAPIAEALGVGHAERIAHRDVKPSNIFLLVASAGVRVKLLDFGVAKLMTTSSTDPQDEQTGARRAAFTPNYAAPEQWLKSYGATGPWTDVYALALVCVELLGTRPALDGDDAGQLMGATFAPERPTPRARGVVVSDAVDAVFARALALMPEERFRSATEFWDALVAATRASRARDDAEDAPASEAAPASASDAASPRATSSRSGKRRTTPSARPTEPRTRPSARDETPPGASGPES